MFSLSLQTFVGSAGAKKSLVNLVFLRKIKERKDGEGAQIRKTGSISPKENKNLKNGQHFALRQAPENEEN